MRGFTYIELMITLAILAVLATASYPLAKLTMQRNKEHELKEGLRQIREGIDRYKQASDEGRIAKGTQDSGYPKALDQLVNGVEDAKDPARRKIYFLRRLPRDPFALATTSSVASWGKRSYSSPPDNPTEGADVFDVFSKSEAIGLNGRPYKEW
jgi:general secretion pathway protein G